MKRVAVKGDVYEIWPNDKNTQEKLTPPPPDPLNPSDPERYSYDPFYPAVSGVVETNKANTGEEFVFCQGKPVIFSGYAFSMCKRDLYFRKWKRIEEGEEAGYLQGTRKDPDDQYKTIPPDIPGKRIGKPSPQDEKKSEDNVDVWATGGSDFVYIDGQPMSCLESGVNCAGTKWAIVEGKLEPVGSVKEPGQFIKGYGHVYTES